jgi:hypothetical protein
MPFPVLAAVSLGIALPAGAAAALLGHRPRLAALAAIAGATALFYLHAAVYFDYYADDAYITLRYSKHLADGLGPNWNAEGRVEGYTTFLWMGVLAGLAKLGADLVDASRVLGFVSFVAALAAVFAIWKLWRDEAPSGGLASPLVPTAAALGLALHDGVSFWGLSGMETPAFMALLTAGGWLFLREQRGSRFPWSAVTFAAAAMTRPEGLLAVGVTGAFIAVETTLAMDRRRAFVSALLWGGVFLALYGPYFLWRYTYYDYLLPNTYYAKVGLTMASFDRGLQYVASAGAQYQLLALFAGLAALATHPRLGRDALYIAALAAAMLAGLVVEGGGDVHGRFIVPVLPLLFLGGLAGYARLLDRGALHSRRVTAIAAIALALAGLSLLPTSRDALLAAGRGAVEDRGRLGAWFNEHTPERYTIADFQVGAIAYYGSDRAFLDLFGLNDVVIAHSDVPGLGRGVVGHEKYNVDYTLDVVRPEILVLGQVHPRPMTAEELRPLIEASQLTRGSAALLTDPRLWQRYTVRAVLLDGRWFHFLQRNDILDDLSGPGLR